MAATLALVRNPAVAAPVHSQVPTLARVRNPAAALVRNPVAVLVHSLVAVLAHNPSFPQRLLTRQWPNVFMTLGHRRRAVKCA